MNVATRLKLEQMERDIKELKEQVAKLLAAQKPAPRETLTLEKRKSA